MEHAQGDRAVGRTAGGQVEAQGAARVGLGEPAVHRARDTVPADRVHPHPRQGAAGTALAAVYHRHAVAGGRVEPGIADLQRAAADRLGVGEPGAGDCLGGVGDGEPLQRRIEKRRIVPEPGAGHQMRLLRRRPEVVVAAAGAGVGAAQDRVHRLQARVLHGQRRDRRAPLLQPEAVVERIFEAVEAGAAAHRLRAVAGHRELRVDALEQRLRQRVDARPQLTLARLGRGVVENPQGAVAGRPRAEVGGAPQLGDGARPGGGLGDQPLADVSVGVGAVEELQEAPDLERPRRRGPLQRLEAQQGRLHRGVGQQRPAPVALQSKDPRGHPVRQIGVNEQPSVLAQHGVDVRLRIPQQGAPQHLVEIVVVALAVGQGAARPGRAQCRDPRLVERPRVDRLAALAGGQRPVPIRDRVLA